jgi:glutamine synthetase
MIEAEGVECVILGVCDLSGALKGKRIPADRLAQVLDSRLPFCEYIVNMDVQTEAVPRPVGYAGWWPDWEQGGRGDMFGVPDLSSFRMIPWLDRTALLLCDFQHVNGEPVAELSREVMRRVLARCELLGLEPTMAAEYEFYLFDDDRSVHPSDGHLRPLWTSRSWLDVAQGSSQEALMAPIRKHLAGAGMRIVSWAPESGPGQFELNMAPAVGMEAADNAVLFKHSIRELAAQQRLAACFMARPMSGEGGSGLHIHISLKRGEDPVFYDDSSQDHLSIAAKQFVAGQLATLPEFSALYAPTINSYKRFQPDLAAGDRVAWAIDNKSVAVRVVNTTPSSCRVELRTPAADANAYLAIAAGLAGGLHGIENELEPPQACEGNAYNEDGLRQMPTSLGEAAGRLAEGDVAREYLGSDFVDLYVATRNWEQARFDAAVTDWEIARYRT